jgi:hypothetical protein
MKRKAWLLLPLLVWSCSGIERANEEFVQKLNKADMIEFKNGDNSARYVNPEILTVLKEMLIPVDSEECKFSDNHEFSLSILLYANSEVIGEIGVEFGHIQYLHYKSGENYYAKSERNARLATFIREIQF